MPLDLHIYSLCFHGIGQAWEGFSLKNKEAALKGKLDTSYIFQTR
ncbi:MAG: hypothetical protein ABR534_16045 [Desulfotignum sp.]